jgi:hypothetical protein
VPDNQGAFGKLLSVLRSQRIYVPSTLTFPQLDLAAASERLRLVERGEQNGRENRPPTTATQPDVAESEIIEIIHEEYARAVDIYRQGLETYDRRIHGNSALETLGVQILGASQDATSDYNLLSLKAQEEILFDREDLLEVENELNKFRSINKLERGCRDPDGHFVHIGVILIVLLLDTIANGYLLSVRDEFGLLGGMLQAILVAAMNVAFGFTAGRLALPNIIHRSFLRRVGGFIGFSILLGLIFVLNLSFAHYRDLSVIGVENPGQQALLESWMTPFIFRDVKSWWLGVLGLLFSFVSLIDGFKWEDTYPGYSQVVRARDTKREEYLNRKHGWLELIRQKREQARDEVTALRHDIDMIHGEILQANTGRRSFSASFAAHVSHLESAANQLMSIYRDANRRARDTPPLAYFEQRWRLVHTEVVAPGEIDRDRLRTQVEGIFTALSEALAKIHEVHDQTIGAFKRLDATDRDGIEPVQRIRLVG